ncbi:hypothetical protein BDW59DRAFT_156335 [Aspergillus cavernicola]|uniref:Aminoglycoside phosphotransferase domain-containing protein n=1 Tax=Aspergillus cavernicola TaxID=176166 RepID=A0ABR4J5Q9_9EURO
MNSAQHMLCTKALSMVLKNLACLGFPAYGSRYFSDGPLESHLKIPFEKGICIGPHCSPVFWNRNPGELNLYSGPSPKIAGPCPYPIPFSATVLTHGRKTGKALASYFLGLVEPGFSRLPKEDNTNREVLPHQGSIQENQPGTEDLTIVTGLIDWQSASIEPAFIYANETPDFAALLEDPEGDAFENDKPTKQKLLDQYHYTHTTWRDSATALPQEFIKLSLTHWAELDLPDACPYIPSEEELKKGARDWKDFETVQRLKLWLKHSLRTNSAGWVPDDGWDAHRAVYEMWIQTARNSEAWGESLTVVKADRLSGRLILGYRVS